MMRQFAAVAILAGLLLAVPSTAQANRSVLRSRPTPHPTPTPAGVQPLGPGGAWTPTFADEFDGTAIDSSKWWNCMWWGCAGLTGEKDEHFQPQNVTEAGGLVTLTARAEVGAFQCIDGVPGYVWTRTSGQLQSGPGRSDLDPGCSGAVPSTIKFAQTYGFFETRIRPVAGGGCSSFWSAAQDEGWPPEWDFEYLGTSNQLNLAIHYGSSNQVDYTLLSLPSDWPSSFHTLGLEWASDHLTWYVDGVVQKMITNTAPVPTKAMYPMVALDVGGGYCGTPSLPAQAQVDYVRVWRR